MCGEKKREKEKKGETSPIQLLLSFKPSQCLTRVDIWRKREKGKEREEGGEKREGERKLIIAHKGGGREREGGRKGGDVSTNTA